jgi:hypothetical protein
MDPKMDTDEPTLLADHAPQVLQDYYRILLAGADAYGEGAELRPLLSEHLEFDGSLAGHVTDATEGFLHGVAGFIATVQAIHLIREVHSGDPRTSASSAVLYSATLPAATVTLAEFFDIEDGRITALHLHYDGPAYLAAGGR